MQAAAEDAFRKSGATKGAVVVMDPHNGDVLAMLSYPPFDPNVFIPRVSQKVYDTLNDTPFHTGDLWYLCIGQGPVTVTPIQMAVMTSAVANGGKLLWPRLIERIEQQTTAPEKTVRIFAPVRIRGELNVKPANLEVVREAMLADVEDNEGTGKFARVAGFKIAGKTGTAEVKPGHDRQDRQNTWFVSFGPYESPRYVVVVLADEGGRSGGRTCAPVARRIYEAIQKFEAKG